MVKCIELQETNFKDVHFLSAVKRVATKKVFPLGGGASPNHISLRVPKRLDLVHIVYRVVVSRKRELFNIYPINSYIPSYWQLSVIHSLCCSVCLRKGRERKQGFRNASHNCAKAIRRKSRGWEMNSIYLFS